MTDQTKPIFKDITNLMDKLPSHPSFEDNGLTIRGETLPYLKKWLEHHSRSMDLSKGFAVNRCALSWAGHDETDSFNGQDFVKSCQDSHGSLNQLASQLNTDLQIFELDPNNHARPTIDDLAMAASYGMMSIEENTQLFCAAAFGQGVDHLSQQAIDNLNKFKTIESFMVDYCGLEHAAILGASIAAIMKGIPMIVEGAAGELVIKLIEKHIGEPYSNILYADLGYDIPGHNIIATAIFLKTTYIASPKTNCGKTKNAA